MLWVQTAFKLIYFLLLIQAIINLVEVKNIQVPGFVRMLFQGIKGLTMVFTKPFQNIFYFPYDVSPLVSMAILAYLVEPVVRVLSNVIFQLL